jgi:Asp-tRNA(Asn)/Glu-tRNA(Gln) amidotransferase A subunit family amidase
VDSDLTNKSAVELAAMIRVRTVSPVEVAEAYLRRIDQINPGLNAIVTLAPDVMDQARAAEAYLMSDREVGLLHGVPLTIKDTIDTMGLRTTSGSRLRAHDVPARDATAVARLRGAGAIILGKSNTPEMALSYETDNPVFGRTNNPHALDRTPGGSSGGEAAAIAACLTPAGLGSDLSGSIRVPAHFCGIVGLKPTTGRVPADGQIPDATGLLSMGECIGPMARTITDLSLLFRVIADPEPNHRGPDQERAKALCELRIAWYADDGVAAVTDETRAAILTAAKAFSDAGLEVFEERPPGVSEGARLWVELFSQPAAEQLREFYRGREDEAGPRASELLAKPETETDLNGKVVRAENVAAAVLERERLREDLLRWMKTTPLILAPVGSVSAFEHGARRVQVGGESISVWRAFSYSQTFNVFGLPSVVVPAGRSIDGLPIGVQIVGRPFDEERVLATAAILEETLGGWQRPSLV